MLDINTVPKFYQTYVRFLKDESVVDMLQSSGKDFKYLLNTFSDEKAMHRYEEGKWSVKDIIQHVIDAERVFTYRAVRFSRNDFTELSGFEQNGYAEHANADSRKMEDLMNEFTSTRYSTISFFDSLDKQAMQRAGVASGVELSVEMLGYIVSGHCLHHLEVIREKYL